MCRPEFPAQRNWGSLSSGDPLPVAAMEAAGFDGKTMTNASPQPAQSSKPVKARPFRRAILRGLGVVMPPLLTLVLFIWAWATIDSYVFKPIENGIGHVVVLFSMQTAVQSEIPKDADPAEVKVVNKQDDIRRDSR